MAYVWIYRCEVACVIMQPRRPFLLIGLFGEGLSGLGVSCWGSCDEVVSVIDGGWFLGLVMV